MSKIKRSIQIKDEESQVFDDAYEWEFVPPTPGEILAHEVELEKAQREYELTKYTVSELKGELYRRGYDVMNVERTS